MFASRKRWLVVLVVLIALPVAALLTFVRYVPEGSLGVVRSDGTVRLAPPGLLVIQPFRETLERIPGEEIEVQDTAEIHTSDGFLARVPFVAKVRLDARRFQAAGGAAPGKDTSQEVETTIALGLALWGGEHEAAEFLTSDLSSSAVEPIRSAGEKIGMLVNSLQLREPDRDLYLFLAEDALSRGEPRGRIALVDTALRSAPDDVRLLTARGMLDEATGDKEAARALYQKALAIDPGFESALSRMFVLLQAEGELFQLETVLSAGAEANPTSVSILNWLALTYLPLGPARYPDAIRVLQKARDLAPQDEATLTNLGGVYQRSGRPDEAVEMYRLALKEEPGSQRLLTNVGLAEAARGDLPAARHALEDALGAGPASVKLHNALAEVYRLSGMRKEATVQLQASYALDPEQPGLRAALTRLLGHPPD